MASIHAIEGISASLFGVLAANLLVEDIFPIQSGGRWAWWNTLVILPGYKSMFAILIPRSTLNVVPIVHRQLASVYTSRTVDVPEK